MSEAEEFHWSGSVSASTAGHLNFNGFGFDEELLALNRYFEKRGWDRSNRHGDRKELSADELYVRRKARSKESNARCKALRKASAKKNAGGAA